MQFARGSRRAARPWTGVRLTWDQYTSLRKVINQHPAYSGIGWTQKTSGHGIP